MDQLLRKRRVRTPAALRAVPPLGGCPYALARFAVLRAASHARTQQSYEDELRPSVVAAALKYFRDERRFLRGVLSGAERKAKVLVDGLDLLELSLPYQKALHGALSRSRVLIEDSIGDIARCTSSCPSTAETFGG